MRSSHFRFTWLWQALCFVALQLVLLMPIAAQAAIPMLASGAQHTCTLTSAGGVKCWGNNSSGQLGDASGTNRLMPVDVSGLTSGVSAIAAGYQSTCALTTGGGVKCWGESQLTPMDVYGLSSGVGSIATGNGHSCALTTGGGVKCWGLNNFGQLGNGGLSQQLTPVNVIGLTTGVIAIAAGGSNPSSSGHTCALTSSGGVKCWGNNSFGELGDGTTANRSTPVDVSGLTSGVLAITAGANHTCALIANHSMKCWGHNLYGQLGDGSTTGRLTPVNVSFPSNDVNTIASGTYFTCAVKVDHTAHCWGHNGYGQLGDGSTVQKIVAVAVSGLEGGVTAIAAGDDHACALTPSNGIKCWGNNTSGQLGDGITVMDAIGLTADIAAVAISKSANRSTRSSSYNHQCVLTTSGGVKCQGDNWYGQLGTNNLTAQSVPTDVTGLTSGVGAITTGAFHTCALTIGGGVKCWGLNADGELGDGTTVNRVIPVDVIGLGSGVIGITAGAKHTCALTVGGGVKCWGWNGSGELGDGTTVNRSSPIDVSGLTSSVTSIAGAGGYTNELFNKVIGHTCAVTTGGGLKCWGSNYYGQLGVGGTTDSAVPVDVLGLSSGVMNVAVSAYHSCILTAQGGVKCWGYNVLGQLGDGTTINRLTPVDVVNLSSGILGLTAAGDTEGGDFNSRTPRSHTCALTKAGGVACWGGNSLGQLGDGTTTNRLVPTSVNGLTGAVAVTASPFYTCALNGSGGVKCWASTPFNGYDDLRLRPSASVYVVGFADNPMMAAAPNPSTPGQSVTFTATVSGASPTGSVNFDFGDGSTIQIVTVTSGQAVTTHAFGTAGAYTVIANYSGDPNNAASTSSFLQNVVGSSRLVNLSTRGQVQTGNNVMIGGFIIGGSTPKKVLIRAVGPNLVNYGVTGVLANPMLELHRSSDGAIIASNDDWASASNASDILATGLAPVYSLESAILATLDPGAYTAIVTGNGGSTGVGIVEVYEIDHPEIPLINISTRGQVQTGSNVMIGGFIIQGDSPQTVLIRAVGPNLANYGVTGVLADPMLELHRSSDGAIIASNDNWGTASNAAAIQATGLAPVDPKESAILITLPPGAYTAIVSGANGGTGVGIVEVFAQ